MNSKKCFDLHKEKYSQFYARHSVVVSLPLCVNRSWSLDQWSWCVLVQKIPLRIIMGISMKHQSSGCERWDITMYTPTLNTFETRPIVDYLPFFDQIMEYVQREYGDLFATNKGTISLFCEAHDTVWLWRYQVVSVLLSSLLYTLGEHDHGDIWWGSLSLSDKTQSGFDSLRLIVNNALRINESLGIRTCMTTMLCCLTEGGGIYTGTTTWSFDDVLRLHEINGWDKDQSYLPFDMTIIYSGKPLLYKHDEDEKLRKYMRIDEWNQLLQWKEGHTIGNQSFGWLLSATNASILHQFYRLLIGWYTDDRYEACIQSINTLKYLHDIIRWPSRQLDEIGHVISSYFGHHNALWSVNYQDLVESGGSLMLLSPRDSHAVLLPQIIDHVLPHYPWMSIVYSYHQDGWEKQWLRIEQDINHHRFSRSVMWNTYTLIQNDGSMTIGELSSLRSNNNCDLVFDLSSSKIYVWGEKLTSQDLHSQSTTIELFQKYLENGFTDVHSNQLSRSSYSRQKSEMSSKILIPLKKMIKSKLSVDFDVKLEWGSSSYTMHVDHAPQLKLWFIKPVG